eukprot:1179990-Prorocentrum_minimum.AAC.1
MRGEGIVQGPRGEQWKPQRGTGHRVRKGEGFLGEDPYTEVILLARTGTSGAAGMRRADGSTRATGQWPSRGGGEVGHVQHMRLWADLVHHPHVVHRRVPADNIGCKCVTSVGPSPAKWWPICHACGPGPARR